MAHTIGSDNIIRGDEVEFGIEAGLGELQLIALRIHNDKVLQVDADTGEELTGALVVNRSICVAEWLKKIGVKPGDSISINSENRLEFTIVPCAGFLVGATFAPLNPDYTAGELNHVLNLSKPSVIFCSMKTFKTMKEIFPQHPSVKKLVLFGNKVVNDKDVVMYNDLVKGVVGDPVDEEYDAVEIDPNESVATILCSSGTTGLPKGVMATHANMTAFIEIARLRVSEMMDGDKENITTLGLLPFFHSMGFMSMYMNLLAGNLMVVLTNFRTKVFLESIQKYKVTTLIVPPPVILVLTKHPLTKNYDLSSLREVRTGAAPMGKDMEEHVQGKYNLRHVSQGYGMTETTLGVLISDYYSPRAGSVGQIVPGMICKVIDESGKALGTNQEGELCFKGPLIMKGYINNPEATKSTIDDEGWLHTGDVSYYDEQGYFFIVDRLKELIKYKAFQVAPAELEALLQTHSGVADAAVIGLPDEAAGELPLAFIVKKHGIPVTEKEIQDFVSSKVSRQKRLRGGVIFIEEIPKNPTGKILRRVLRERAKAMKSKSKL